MSKKDGELSTWLVVGGVFTVALLVIDVFVAKWHLMSMMLMAVVILLHLVVAGLWIGTMKKFNDPNFDYLRKLTVWAAIATICVIMLHHSAWLENEFFKQTVEQNKAAQ